MPQRKLKTGLLCTQAGHSLATVLLTLGRPQDSPGRQGAGGYLQPWLMRPACTSGWSNLRQRLCNAELNAVRRQPHGGWLFAPAARESLRQPSMGVPNACKNRDVQTGSNGAMITVHHLETSRSQHILCSWKVGLPYQLKVYQRDKHPVCPS